MPQGVDEFRTNHVKSRNIIAGDDTETNPNKDILFIGSTNRTENKRSKLIRRYASRVHGVELPREDARLILKNMFAFLTRLLPAIEKKESCKLMDGNASGFTLSADVWRMIPHSNEDKVYICDTCGCEHHYDPRDLPEQQLLRNPQQTHLCRSSL